MKNVLENILQPLIGVLMLVLYFVWAINNYPQYLREMTIACAILSCAIIANRMVDVIIEHHMKTTKQWIVKFAVSTVIYFVSLNILSYIANMPARNILILSIGVGYAVVHMMLGIIINSVIANKPLILPAFEEKIINDDFSCDKMD